MTLTWTRQAAAAVRGTVAPATLAPATSTAAGVLPQAAVPAEQRRQAAGLLRDLYDYLLANAGSPQQVLDRIQQVAAG